MAGDDQEQAGLLAHLDSLMDELHDNVPKALKQFDADGAHDARVATRRLKAAMELFGPILKDDRRKEFEKVLKKIRRRLGPMRDLDVMIEALAKLESHPTQGPAAVWLRQHLEQQRDKERDASKDKPGSADLLSKLGSWWHVREEIADAQDTIDPLLAESLHLQFDEFAERAAGVVQRIEAPQANDPRQDPHELRIAGKQLRYTLELAQAQGHPLSAGVLRPFKQMQQALGNWHDDVVLMQCAMQTSLDEMLAYHDLAMQEKMLGLVRFFLHRAARELSNFARFWRKRGEHVSNVIREKMPLTPKANESKTDPDPAGSDDTSGPQATAPDVASGV